MKKMIAFLTAMLMLLFLMTFNNGCKKDSQPAEYELGFNITAGQQLKSTEDVPCFEQLADYVKVNISGTEYKLDVFYVDDKPFTKTVILPEGNYTINEFVLWNDNGTEDLADDWVMAATPHVESAYAQFVNYPLTRTFNIEEFAKTSYPMEVVCYQEDEFENFGFIYYNIQGVTIIEECFYGDFCIKHAQDYAGSLYAEQSNYPETGYYDAPAIFKIDVFRNGVKTGSYNNEQSLGSQPLCVEYGDRENITDNFIFEMWILVKNGPNYEYRYFHGWETTDNLPLTQNEFGIVDFVLGTCQEDATVQLPPYQNLPMSGNVTFLSPNDPLNTTPGYWGVKINSVIPLPTYPLTDYDLPVGQLMAGWCGDHFTTLGPGTYNNVYFHSSLNTNGWPTDMPFTLETAAKMNWLFNNLSNYGMDINNLSDSQGLVIQDVIWRIIHGSSWPLNPGETVINMTNESNLHSDYLPLPGGWAAVLMIKDNNVDAYQLIFTIVDP